MPGSNEGISLTHLVEGNDNDTRRGRHENVPEYIAVASHSVPLHDSAGHGGSFMKPRLKYLAVATIASLYMLPFMRFALIGSDEGILLVETERIVNGQVYARDFWPGAGPGTLYLLATWFKSFWRFIHRSADLPVPHALGDWRTGFLFIPTPVRKPLAGPMCPPDGNIFRIHWLRSQSSF